jgi:4-nitrophenyl phosphatase
MSWLLDLDGVVWLADVPIPGSVDAIATLRDRGERVVFLTNNSSATVADYLAKLNAFGIPIDAADLITSAQAAARMLERGSTALVCAGPGVDQALADRGVATVREGPADAVVVGWHRDFDYGRLTAAFLAVKSGARLIGTNDDATYPMPDGLVPGGGALVAAVAYASGVPADFAGKPYAPVVELTRERVASITVMVGDRPSTDGLMARALGVPFGLVLSGVTTASDLPVEPKPDLVANSLAELVEQMQ